MTNEVQSGMPDDVLDPQVPQKKNLIHRIPLAVLVIFAALLLAVLWFSFDRSNIPVIRKTTDGNVTTNILLEAVDCSEKLEIKWLHYHSFGRGDIDSVALYFGNTALYLGVLEEILMLKPSQPPLPVDTSIPTVLFTESNPYAEDFSDWSNRGHINIFVDPSQFPQSRFENASACVQKHKTEIDRLLNLVARETTPKKFYTPLELNGMTRISQYDLSRVIEAINAPESVAGELPTAHIERLKETITNTYKILGSSPQISMHYWGQCTHILCPADVRVCACATSTTTPNP